MSSEAIRLAFFEQLKSRKDRLQQEWWKIRDEQGQLMVDEFKLNMSFDTLKIEAQKLLREISVDRNPYKMLAYLLCLGGLRENTTYYSLKPFSTDDTEFTNGYFSKDTLFSLIGSGQTFSNNNTYNKYAQMQVSDVLFDVQNHRQTHQGKSTFGSAMVFLKLSYTDPLSNKVINFVNPATGSDWIGFFSDIGKSALTKEQALSNNLNRFTAYAEFTKEALLKGVRPKATAFPYSNNKIPLSVDNQLFYNGQFDFNVTPTPHGQFNRFKNTNLSSWLSEQGAADKFYNDFMATVNRLMPLVVDLMFNTIQYSNLRNYINQMLTDFSKQETDFKAWILDQKSKLEVMGILVPSAEEVLDEIKSTERPKTETIVEIVSPPQVEPLVVENKPVVEIEAKNNTGLIIGLTAAAIAALYMMG